MMRDRLLDIHVLARLTGPDADERMPVVRRRDGDGVHVLGFEQLSDIGKRRDLFAARPGLANVLGQHSRVHVAQRDQPQPFRGRRGLDVALAAAANADHRHADRVIGAALAAERRDACDARRRQRRSGHHGTAKKTATSQSGHGWFSCKTSVENVAMMLRRSLRLNAPPPLESINKPVPPRPRLWRESIRSPRREEGDWFQNDNGGRL